MKATLIYSFKMLSENSYLKKKVTGLKILGPLNGSCEFKSRPGHHLAKDINNLAVLILKNSSFFRPSKRTKADLKRHKNSLIEYKMMSILYSFVRRTTPYRLTFKHNHF